MKSSFLTGHLAKPDLSHKTLFQLVTLQCSSAQETKSSECSVRSVYSHCALSPLMSLVASNQAIRPTPWA